MKFTLVRDEREVVPILTLTIFMATATITAIGYAFPELVYLLRRDAGMVADGQYWRLVSSVLVNPEGWKQVVANTLGLLALGTIIERQYGRVRWLHFYLAGTVAGEISGLAWNPIGAGSSVAICGLLGGAAMWLFMGIGTVPARVGASLVFAGAAVLAVKHDLHGPAILAGALVGILFARRR